MVLCINLDPGDIIAICALVAALFSVVFTIIIAQRNVKPLIAIVASNEGSKQKYVYLKNYGLGTAIITEIYIEHPDKTNGLIDLAECLNIDKQKCEESWVFSQKTYYVAPQEKIYLILLPKENTDQENKQFSTGLKKIKIAVKYRSVFRNKKEYKRDFAKDKSKYCDEVKY